LQQVPTTPFLGPEPETNPATPPHNAGNASVGQSGLRAFTCAVYTPGLPQLFAGFSRFPCGWRS
jgi:hypothetical protein